MPQLSDRILQTVPNVSEGRDPAVIRELTAALAGSGAQVADVHVDADHHRSVFTVFGTADQLRRSLVDLARASRDALDIAAHTGVHPRLGTLDVVPIVALDSLLGAVVGGDVVDAQVLAGEVASGIGALGIPVIRYGEATAFPDTGSVRGLGGADAIVQRIATGEITLAAGPPQLHARAGLTLVGVRQVLVAFNVELDSGDLALARGIAAVLRERGGGLPGVRALAFSTTSRQTVQVSTNILRWAEAGPAEVLERVADLAASQGAGVVSAELVGLAPRDAMHDLGIAVRRNHVRLRAAREPSLEVRARLARDRIERGARGDADTSR